MSECGRAMHEHKGKSSERLLDKGKILAALPVFAGQTVLDAGCGDGYMAMEFARLVGETGRVYAMDADSASIEAHKARLAAHAIEALTGDITATTHLPAGSMDLIYLSAVLHGFSEEQMHGFVQEAQRLLKPQGVLAILEIKKEKTAFGPPLAIRISPQELISRMPLAAGAMVEINDSFYLQRFAKGC